MGSGIGHQASVSGVAHGLKFTIYLSLK